MSLPQTVGLPAELDYSNGAGVSLPASARSWEVSVAPSNLSQVASSPQTLACAAGTYSELTFPSQTLYFDVPCGGSDSIFLDPQSTTISFTAKYEITTAGTAYQANARLRGSAASFFDRMYIQSSNGQIVEDTPELGLIYDTLCQLMMNNSTRDSVAVAYGFNSDNTITNTGHIINGIQQGDEVAVNEASLHSYSIPLISGVLGTHASRNLNVGRLSKLQLALTTASVAPVTIIRSAGTADAACKITLENFRLNLKLVDVGPQALAMIDKTLYGNTMYMHGISHKVSSSTVPAVAGSGSLNCNIRSSSLKALITRFHEGGTAAAARSTHGKYDSKMPAGMNFYAYNIGGVQYPNNSVNPLLEPARAYSNLQQAVGSFNNYAYQGSIPIESYTVQGEGGAAAAYTIAATQAYAWNKTTDIAKEASFFLGENLEVVSKKSILSGLDVGSASVFLNYNLSVTPTNPSTAYTIGICDFVLIHDVNMRDLQARS
jgi:hypothetical protein